MREGASEQSSDLKNYTAPGPRPPVLKFLDPPLVWSLKINHNIISQQRCTTDHSNEYEVIILDLKPYVKKYVKMALKSMTVEA